MWTAQRSLKYDTGPLDVVTEANGQLVLNSITGDYQAC